MKYTTFAGGVAALAAAAISTSGYAQSVQGNIESTIVLEAACEVNGATETTGVDFGTLDFGTHSTLFDEATSAVEGNGAGAISVQCTPGADASLTIVSGANDADAISGGTRALKNGSLVVPYDIYSDEARTLRLDNDSAVEFTADGTVQTVNIYGKAVGTAGLTAGTYTDTISVNLEF